VRLGVYAPRAERVQLAKELLDVENDAVAEQAAFSGVQHAGRYLVEDELLVRDVDRMARIRTTLTARDEGRARRNHVDDLALALVAPRGTDDNEAARIPHPP
jgi:hypothetical protein